MKKLLICIAALSLMTAPAFAQGVRQSPSGNPGAGTLSDPISDGHAHHRNNGDEADGEQPTRPVPEPGTMALASMGLIALGAAARKRRGN